MKKVKDISRISGLSKRTLQYYDDKGLLSVKRSKENYRLYDDEDLERLWQIMLYKKAGFKLDEIRTLQNLSEDDTKKALQNRIDQISTEISRLDEQKWLAQAMKGDGVPPICTYDNAKNKITYVEAISTLQYRIQKNSNIRSMEDNS